MKSGGKQSISSKKQSNKSGRRGKAFDAKSAAEDFLTSMDPEEGEKEEESKKKAPTHITNYRTPKFSQRSIVASMTPPREIVGCWINIEGTRRLTNTL